MFFQTQVFLSTYTFTFRYFSHYFLPLYRSYDSYLNADENIFLYPTLWDVLVSLGPEIERSFALLRLDLSGHGNG